MKKYFCDLCGKEMGDISPRFQVRKGPSLTYRDNPPVAQIATVFISHEKKIEHICGVCIAEATANGPVNP